MKKPIVITMGDPAGIGPEIILRSFAQRFESKLPPFCVLGDPGVLMAMAKVCGIDLHIQSITIDEPLDEIWSSSLPCIPVPVRVSPTPGVPSQENAAAIIECLDLAATYVLEGKASGVVTAPVAKSVLYDSGFNFPGQTEFFAERAKSEEFVMMLVGPDLKIVPTTIHVALADVPKALTADLVRRTVRVTHRALKQDFGIAEPRIAVTGLNPHAGEDGQIGTEDRDVIEPVIAELKSDGMHITGPHPADGLFHASARTTYDAVVAMYHDQALIPLKTLNFDKGVNITAGLSIIRTSPDHGTAFDIAGKGLARPDSMIAAVKIAGEIADRRAGNA